MRKKVYPLKIRMKHSDQEEQKPLHSAPTENKISTSEEVEQGELKQDPSLDRLGSLPLWEMEEEKSPIGERSTSEQVKMEPWQFASTGEKIFRI